MTCLVAACATAPQTPAPSGTAQQAPVAAPAAAPAQAILPPPRSGTTAHIALLLPLKSTNAYLQRAADAIQQGFLAASVVQPTPLPIRVYGCADEGKEMVALYQQAIESGAVAIVGPATRAGVTAVAAQATIAVPTLALNTAEKVVVNENLYYFGLTLESEARQIARLARAEDLHAASIVASDSPLSKRLSQAFSEEWKSRGGQITEVKTFVGNTAELADLPFEPGNMVFVAATADKARVFRPFLNAVLPVYATSQVFKGNGDQMVNYDLRDINFIDMPWILQPDHPAVMIYPRATPALEIDMDRLYALGIDSYRLLQIILNRHLATLPLDGVTGIVRLNAASHQFEREALPAIFRQGMGVAVEGSASHTRPDQGGK